MIALLASLLVAQFPTWSLAGETADWLGVLANRGYTVFQYHGVILRIGESRTLPITLQATGEGIYGALGGPNALMIDLELLNGDELLCSCGTDDMPLVYMPVDSSGLVSHLRFTITDMTHGATAESIFVYAVIKPVDPDSL